MDISEMHKMFRQYAQQMGMQNVRAILPEQIDLFVNNSISDTINQVITQNIGITNDRVISDASKLNQVNALKSLYKVWKGSITNVTVKGKEKTSYIISFQLPLNNFKTTGSYTDMVIHLLQLVFYIWLIYQLIIRNQILLLTYFQFV